MKTQRLHDLGQSLWLDDFSRALLDDSTLRSYIDERSITGVTSNLTIFECAMGQASVYDRGIRDQATAVRTSQALLIELALEDLRRAASEPARAYDSSINAPIRRYRQLRGRTA